MLVGLFSWLCIFSACGSVFSFGVYQDHYQTLSLAPDTPFTGATPAEIEIIGTLAAALHTAAAPLAAGWTKRFGPRRVILLGGALSLTAALLASVSQKLWQFVLTQGILAGLGACFSYMPPVTVSPTWYGKHRALCMGAILSSTGLGGLFFSPCIHALIEAVGLRNAIRAAGAFTTALVALGSFVIAWDPASQARLDAEHARLAARPHSRLRAVWDVPLVDWRIARTRAFGAQLAASALQASAYFTPVFFFSAYARTLGYSAREGSNFIALSNAANAIGKIVFGSVADRCGRGNMLLFTAVVTAASSMALWLPSTLVSLPASRGLFVSYAIVYGAFAGSYVSLFPAAVVEVFGPANFASVNGILYMARGVGTLAGTPSAGALVHHSLDAARGSYFHMTVMVSGLLVVGTAAVTWGCLEGRKWRA